MGGWWPYQNVIDGILALIDEDLLMCTECGNVVFKRDIDYETNWFTDEAHERAYKNGCGNCMGQPTWYLVSLEKASGYKRKDAEPNPEATP